MEREALKLALEALNDMACWQEGREVDIGFDEPYAADTSRKAIAAIKEALAQDVPETGFGNMAQPAHEQWNAALDEAAARIGEIKGFGQATQDSFAVYIKGLKK